MPDPFERHSRNAWEWGPAPPRGQARQAAADQELATPKRPPAKKDRDLCKAQHWKGLHTPVMRIRHPAAWRRVSKCEWRASWGRPPEPRWHCYHEEVCSGCGKVLSMSVGADRCPDYRPVTAAEQAEIDEVIERWTTRRNRPIRTRIDGPQGYRKPKGDK